MESQPAHPSFPRKGSPELQRREFDVGPVAQIGAAQIPGNLFDDRQVRDFEAVIASIDRRIFAKFDPDTVVLPGHGLATTVGNEAPHLQEWVDRGW